MEEREKLEIHRHTEMERAGLDRMLASKQKRKFHMTDRMLQFFVYADLPREQQDISRPFGELALRICSDLPSNPERTVALRKLLEAKDCAVRALVYREPNSEKVHETAGQAQQRLAPDAAKPVGGKETINKID